MNGNSITLLLTVHIRLTNLGPRVHSFLRKEKKSKQGVEFTTENCTRDLPNRKGSTIRLSKNCRKANTLNLKRNTAFCFAHMRKGKSQGSNGGTKAQP